MLQLLQMLSAWTEMDKYWVVTPTFTPIHPSLFDGKRPDGRLTANVWSPEFFNCMLKTGDSSEAEFKQEDSSNVALHLACMSTSLLSSVFNMQSTNSGLHIVRWGPPLHTTWKGQGNVEYLSCARCDYNRNPIRLQQSLAWTMNPISFTAQDGKYPGKRNCFHEAANQVAKVLRYDRIREQKSGQ